MTPKNIPEFITLIKRYESITLEEVESNYEGGIFSGYDIANRLTGFGNTSTCSLCLATCHNCIECVYGKNKGCVKGIFAKSSDDIENSDSPKELLNAFRNRAKVLRQYAASIGINIE